MFFFKVTATRVKIHFYIKYILKMGSYKTLCGLKINIGNN